MRLLRAFIGVSLLVCRVASAEEGSPAEPPPAAPQAPVVAAPALRVTPAVRPGAWVIGELGVRSATTAGKAETFQTAELSRAFLWVDVERGAAFGKVLVEAVRAEQEGAVTGVAGDSLVLRAREAWGGAKWRSWASARVGVVPLAIVPLADGWLRARALGPTLAERSRLLFPSDVGATASALAPGGLGELRVSVTTGEGYTQRERNDGKNTEVALRLRPFGDARDALPLEGAASVSVGSQGTLRTRSNRVSGLVAWTGARVRGGAMVVQATGVDLDGKAKALVAEAFVRVEPYGDLLVIARAGRWTRRQTGSDRIDVASLGVGWRIAPECEVFAVGTSSRPSDTALSAMPGTKFQEARLVGSFRFEETSP